MRTGSWICVNGQKAGRVSSGSFPCDIFDSYRKIVREGLGWVIREFPHFRPSAHSLNALAGGAFPSSDWSPNAISLTCPPDVKPGQAPPNTRIRSDTRGLGPDRSKLDTGLRPEDRNGVLFPEGLGPRFQTPRNI